MSVLPMLAVRRGAAAVDFYQRAFGAQELFRVTSATGETVARMSLSGSEFWLADESPEHLNFSPETLGGGTVRLIVVVDDPQAVFERAVVAGAREVSPVVEEHGWRVGRVVDPFGHHWEIGKPLGEPQ